jgi:putative transposase
VPGGTYFFTVVTQGRARFLCEPDARVHLRAAFQSCRERWPFRTFAIVLLPDHLHAIWILPQGDADYSRRWAFLKKTFTSNWLAAEGGEGRASAGWQRQGRRGVWQPRFWEHTIFDEIDLQRHVDYILYNPVKHGLCPCPRDWPYSSFARFARSGDYPADWGCPDRLTRPLDFSDIAASIYDL